jgi:hypothetical protein
MNFDDDYMIYDAVMILYTEGPDNDENVGPIVEQEEVALAGGRSKPGKAPNIDRRRLFYAQLLHDDFWGPTPVYSASYFKLFFKLPLALFNEILDKVVLHDSDFVQKRDAAGKLGLTPHQKICSAVRQLTSGVSPMEFDDKYRMGASTGMEAMKRYCEAVVSVYSDVALRHPTKEDIDHLLDEGNSAGFPGCIGSIDCMHWNWKNCPSSWKGMFQGKSGRPTVILEAIADHNCRFWHFNFGNPGSMNDINVLDRSPLFSNAVKGDAPQVTYTVNGNDYNYAYWLADGIYPTYASFVKTVSKPNTRREKYFAAKQEAKRKDIERAFGILQARFHVLTSGCRLWDREAMDLVIRTSVILHNLIIDHERANGEDPTYITGPEYTPNHGFTVVPRFENQTIEDRRAMMDQMKSVGDHNRLRHDLMTEMWEAYTMEEEGIDDDAN